LNYSLRGAFLKFMVSVLVEHFYHFWTEGKHAVYLNENK